MTCVGLACGGSNGCCPQRAAVTVLNLGGPFWGEGCKSCANGVLEGRRPSWTNALNWGKRLKPFLLPVPTPKSTKRLLVEAPQNDGRRVSALSGRPPRLSEDDKPLMRSSVRSSAQKAVRSSRVGGVTVGERVSGWKARHLVFTTWILVCSAF